MFVRDLRREATYPLVFDVWQEKLDSGTFFGVQDTGQASMPDYSTAAQNSAVDAALLAELCGSEVPEVPSKTVSARELFPKREEASRGSSTYIGREPGVGHGRDRRVTDALRRIENGLHLDSAVDRHGGTRTEYPEDNESSRRLLMAGVDMDVSNWDGLGVPLPQADLWNTDFSVVMHGDMHPGRDVLRQPPGDLHLPSGALLPFQQMVTNFSSPIGADPSAVPMFHFQVRTPRRLRKCLTFDHPALR